MKIAMVSVHATVHVAELSAALARHGHHVSVFNRRDDPDVPECVETPEGYTVFHMPAGPPEHVPEDELLKYMGPFAQYVDAQWPSTGPMSHMRGAGCRASPLSWPPGISGCPRSRRLTASAWYRGSVPAAGDGGQDR